MRLSDLFPFRARIAGLLVFLALVSAMPSEACSQAASIRSVSNLTMIDANGKAVGAAFGFAHGITLPTPYWPQIVLQINDHVITATVRPNGFHRGTSHLNFKALDCQGQPFMDAGFGDFFVASALAPPGTTLYLPDLTGPPSPPAKFESFFISEESLCANYGAFAPTVALVPAVATIDLHALFTPPFSLRATPGNVVGAQIFNDVPPTHLFFPFIQALAVAGITGGCSVSPPLYCPDEPITRGQAAVFFSRGLHLLP